MLLKQLLSAVCITAAILSLLAISLSHPLRAAAKTGFYAGLDRIKPKAQEESTFPSTLKSTKPRLLEPGEQPPEKDWCLKGEDGGYKDLSCYLSEEDHKAVFHNAHLEYHEVFSNMSKDGRFFLMDFGPDHNTYNPNIIPHPRRDDTWIIVAHMDKAHDWSVNFKLELICNAHFVDNTMKCEKSPLNLPIASTVSKHCTEALDFLNWMVGPHDARVFHGPDRPYALYGSLGKRTCLTQFLQDLRRLVDWEAGGVLNSTEPFFWATELQRPPPYGRLEKNWFLFWDTKGQMYVHTTLNTKKRVFAKMNVDGSVGADLAPKAAASDKVCMDRWMPKMLTNKEWIHQSTNSLLVTMCNRGECEPSPENTFLFFIFQHKTFYMHGNYEPYVMMIKQEAPFEIHGISDKPLWIAGREVANGPYAKGTNKPKDQNEFLFIVSFSWKSKENTYHGYLDDTLFLAFGIEDSHSGMIDVQAADLLANIAYCRDVPAASVGDGG